MNKEDNKAINTVKDNLFNKIIWYEECIDGYTIRMNASATLSDVMSVKAQMMEDLIRYMPLHQSHCCFCVRNTKSGRNYPDCTACWYGINKGFCTNTEDTEASYKNFMKAYYNLLQSIYCYWNKEDFYKCMNITASQGDINLTKFNIVDHIERNKKLLSDYKLGISETKSVPHLMIIKKCMMETIINAIPKSSPHCIFCVIKSNSHGESCNLCNDCWYSINKGNCNDRGSAYQQLTEAITVMKKEISNYWTHEDTIKYNTQN